jgi:bacterioferritin-associated ferredoxin
MAREDRRKKKWGRRGPRGASLEIDIDFHFRRSTFRLMLVCHCKGVTERDVRDAIRSGACSHREIARRCGAGSMCGGCRPVIDELLGTSDAAPASVSFEFAAAS